MLCAAVLLAGAAVAAHAVADKPLPAMHDGLVVSGGGPYSHEGELFVQGKVALSHLTLDLAGPICVAAGASLTLDHVKLLVSDPPSARNGVSGLRCEGPAHVVVRNSTMAPVGTAHPMWGLRGEVDVSNFDTVNSEFHLDHAKARLDNLKIFELEISNQSQVTARGLDLVFLSTHAGPDDQLRFADIPVEKKFSQTLTLGSGARAEIADSRLQIFLLYLHGKASASLSHLDRVQLALFPECAGTLRLPHGRLGTDDRPALFPAPGSSDCPFHLSLIDVNVDTWDVYASGHAALTFEDSLIDELVAGGDAQIKVRDSTLYADWLGLSGDARLEVENSTVGALGLAKERPDLATSEIQAGGRSFARFSGVRFDCGIVATDQAHVEIVHPAAAPKFTRHSGSAEIVTK